MKRNLAKVILLAYLLMACGCAVAVLGIGAAAGTGAAYFKGKDSRLYDSEYHRTAQACMETLAALKIPVVQTSADELKTTIHAKRADETPVSIEVVRAGPGRCEVSIRNGAVGISGLEAANQIHNALKERLGRSSPESAKTIAAPKNQLDDSTPLSEGLVKQGPSRKKSESPSISIARRTPPEFTIYFMRDSNEVRPSEMAKLDHTADLISQLPEAKLILSGYTDAVGSTDYNLMIAESRASAVKFYLVGKGVDPLRITVVGKGGMDFVSGNDTEEGRNLNRRVEIYIDGAR
jgi:outer membrane protein OmpA-like peptidoglycan-associated protein